MTAYIVAVVRHMSNRIAVMCLGRIVEVTDREMLHKDSLHPYSRALLSAVPVADPLIEDRRERTLLQREIPSPLNPPPGCHFHPKASVGR